MKRAMKRSPESLKFSLNESEFVRTMIVEQRISNTGHRIISFVTFVNDHIVFFAAQNFEMNEVISEKNVNAFLDRSVGMERKVSISSRIFSQSNKHLIFFDSFVVRNDGILLILCNVRFFLLFRDSE